MNRHDIDFDRTVHATEDLGWDADGEKPIDVPTDDGLLVEVPPGEYAFPLDDGDEPACVRGDLTDWGIRGLGEKPQDVTFRTVSGESGYFVRGGYNSEGILLENLAFDNTDAREGGDVGNWLRAKDNVEVHDVDHVGFSGREPYCRWSILPAITSEHGEATIVRYRKTGPSVFAGHGASDGGGGVFDHEGHATFRDCEIANQGGDGGLYTGKHDGSVRFEDCVFRNNDMAAIRMGAGSELRNCEIVVDWENAHPENVVDDAEPPTGTAGVYVSSAQYGKSGGGIYGCTIRLRSTYGRGMAGILVNPSDGAIDLHDTTVECAFDMRPVWFMDPREQRFDGHTTPDEPWGVDIRNLTVTGSSPCRGQAAVVLEGRHGSTIDGLTIDVPNAPAGLDVRESEGVRLGAHDVRVDGPTVRGEVHVDGGGDSDARPDSAVEGGETVGGERRSLRDRLTSLFGR
ncbi:right-handed parallel beta-helix repeat-containing protein [Halomarina rubra]|uniref:Right-handed parallel beta-helix repeat-containing protein n=1 Tax=Halomarina rubra TaxID=2071873 RepID=A0ABD6AS46_9EURY|nr:right-handed parallel beta-helix repeat-containing protein [Halomarina rubra]